MTKVVATENFTKTDFIKWVTRQIPMLNEKTMCREMFENHISCEYAKY